MDNVQIGNYVSWYGRPKRLNRYEVFEISSGSTAAKPLKLTSDFLEKELRFIHHKGVWIHKSTGFSVQLSCDDATLLADGFYYPRMPLVVFRQVHVLQNFFEIVTGKKL